MEVKTTRSLEELRNAIDALDDQIVELLSRRMEVVREVGHVKAKMNTSKSFVRPGREASMVRRLVGQLRNVLPPAAVCSIWRTIIASSLNTEQPMRVAVVSPEGKDDCYWLTREYFGAFIPISCHSTMHQVIGDVAQDRVSVGVLPFPDEITKDSPWLMLGSSEEAPRIFACIPFIHQRNVDDIPLVAIAKTRPEPTGDDHTLVIIETKADISRTSLDKAFAKAGLRPEWLSLKESEPAEVPRYYVIVFPEFITQEDPRLQQVLDSLGETEVTFFVLGAFATPLQC